MNTVDVASNWFRELSDSTRNCSCGRNSISGFIIRATSTDVCSTGGPSSSFSAAMRLPISSAASRCAAFASPKPWNAHNSPCDTRASRSSPPASDSSRLASVTALSAFVPVRSRIASSSASLSAAGPASRSRSLGRCSPGMSRISTGRRRGSCSIRSPMFVIPAEAGIPSHAFSSLMGRIIRERTANALRARVTPRIPSPYKGRGLG